ncbi:hypothetical protein [Longimycelium tulufanense]|nr:hypothetical protein [Longimycelium tulufanense]
MQVVGESHYQPALALVADGRVTGSNLKEAIPAEALLVPEPHNPYDRRAVRVDLLTSFGRAVTVGYLARPDAARYQPVLLALQHRGEIGSCPARIMGGGDRYYGVHLHLAAPASLLGPETDVDAEPPRVLPAERTVVVTREEAHQDVLLPYQPKVPGDIVPVRLELGFCEISKGTYRGEQAVEVRLDGRRCGELTYAMTGRYARWVKQWAMDGPVLCEGYVRHEGQRGLQVELRLPEVS